MLATGLRNGNADDGRHGTYASFSRARRRCAVILRPLYWLEELL